MLASIKMGLVGGQRAITPLAAVLISAARGELPEDNGGPAFLKNPFVATGALMLAAAEMAGDKQKTAPDRIVPIGLAARFVSSAIAGAALAPKRDRWTAAFTAGAVAALASFPGWSLRMKSMDRYGQTKTGFVEDVLVVASAVAIIRGQRDS